MAAKDLVHQRRCGYTELEKAMDGRLLIGCSLTRATALADLHPFRLDRGKWDLSLGFPVEVVARFFGDGGGRLDDINGEVARWRWGGKEREEDRMTIMEDLVVLCRWSIGVGGERRDEGRGLEGDLVRVGGFPAMVGVVHRSSWRERGCIGLAVLVNEGRDEMKEVNGAGEVCFPANRGRN
ncbi:hypothetical protein HAX54_032177 [Datura stramonium]|uniref:Uncharacterized protein n=1 Tax=Datura stramonium TaxID=4076 RepID=A0ABS8VDY3_DATST|nr:hypothetical protein [Datura stramonium]